MATMSIVLLTSIVVLEAILKQFFYKKSKSLLGIKKNSKTVFVTFSLENENIWT